MDDNKITELFFERSESALDVLNEKYGASVKNIAMNILGCREDAEECANDAYFAVWNSIPPEKPNSLFAYVCRIARNIALNRYRHNKAAKRNGHFNLSLEEIEEIIPSGQSVEEHIEREELTAMLNAWLKELDQTDLYIFLQKYWYMSDLDEICAQARLSKSAVYRRLERLKDDLYRYLAKRNVFCETKGGTAQ